MAKRKRYHHGDLREALLAAVGEIIREQGIGFVSLREVARRAKVSHGAPAHHFKNKEGLLLAFAAQGWEKLAQEMMSALAGGKARDGAEALQSAGAMYVQFAIANPEQFTFMFRRERTLTPEYRRARDASFGALSATLQRCQSEGFLEGIDLPLATITAWSTMHGLAQLLLSGRVQDRFGETDVERVSNAVARLFVDALLRKKLKPVKPAR